MGNLPANVAKGVCPFCDMPTQRVLMRNAHAYAVRDGFPVTSGHSLVIPKRHVADYFGLMQEELLACDELIRRLRESLLRDDPFIAGFNIGANAGGRCWTDGLSLPYSFDSSPGKRRRGSTRRRAAPHPGQGLLLSERVSLL